MLRGRFVASSGVFLSLVLALGGLTTVRAAEGDEPAPKAKAPVKEVITAKSPRADEKAAEKKIRAALDKSISFEFLDTPLRDVITYLEDVSGVPFVIDRKGLETVGSAIDTPITLRVKEISLRSGLNLVLKQLESDTTWVIRDEVLYITSRDAANAHTTIRVYDVRDLLGDAEASRAGPTADNFVATLKGSVASDTWDDRGGAGTVQQYNGDGILIITQAATAHEAIEALLAQLRETRGGDGGNGG